MVRVTLIGGGWRRVEGSIPRPFTRGAEIYRRLGGGFSAFVYPTRWNP